MFGFGSAQREWSAGQVHIQTIPSTGFSSSHLEAVASRWKLSRAVASWVGATGLDLIEIPDYKGEAPFLPRLKIPVLVRCHGNISTLSSIYGRRPSRMTRLFESLQLKRATHRVAISPFFEAATTRVFPSLKPATATIPNMIDTRLFRPVEEVSRDPKTVLFAGKLSPLKGSRKMLAIMKQLLIDSEIRIKIVGWLLDKRLKKFVQNHKHRIDTLEGVSREEMPRIYTAAGCLVMPSSAEAFGLSALEAMACGCLPVVPADSGPASFVNRRETGVVLPAFSFSATRWASEIRNLCLHDNENMRRSAIENAQLYRSEAIIQQNVALYEKIVSRWN